MYIAIKDVKQNRLVISYCECWNDWDLLSEYHRIIKIISKPV